MTSSLAFVAHRCRLQLFRVYVVEARDQHPCSRGGSSHPCPVALRGRDGQRLRHGPAGHLRHIMAQGSVSLRFATVDCLATPSVEPGLDGLVMDGKGTELERGKIGTSGLRLLVQSRRRASRGPLGSLESCGSLSCREAAARQAPLASSPPE
jgi:hypothetical protein